VGEAEVNDEVTLHDKLALMEREIMLCERVYAAYTEGIDKTTAMRQLAILRAIASDYRRQMVDQNQ